MKRFTRSPIIYFVAKHYLIFGGIWLLFVAVIIYLHYQDPPKPVKPGHYQSLYIRPRNVVGLWARQEGKDSSEFPVIKEYWFSFLSSISGNADEPFDGPVFATITIDYVTNPPLLVQRETVRARVTIFDSSTSRGRMRVEFSNKSMPMYFHGAKLALLKLDLEKARSVAKNAKH